MLGEKELNCLVSCDVLQHAKMEGNDKLTADKWSFILYTSTQQNYIVMLIVLVNLMWFLCGQ